MFERIGAHTAAAIGLAAMMASAQKPLCAQERGGMVQGIVRDSSGGPVSGAFVKIKNAERRLTFMVVSQAQGRFSVKNLPVGKYVAQAIGGEFQSSPSAPVAVGRGASTTVDLAVTVPRAAQLPAAWPGRLPGQQGGGGDEAARGASPRLPEGAGKEIVQTKCVACHDAQRIVRVRADRDRWQQLIQNMRAYAQGSTLAKNLTDQEAKIVLDYVAANFAGSRAGGKAPPDPNSRLPRTLAQGAATRYLAVEYELPDNKAEPHEITVDSEGNGWVTQRTGGKLGRLDGKTLIYTEIEPPAGQSKTNRLNGITRAPDDKLWFIDGGPNRRWLSYDTKANRFTVYELPESLD